ncbi:DNA ligase/mRNA capping enzyme [Tuber magnatum]|uniref:DNA ligase/mRNA capping enzyme n=1 Tax=Tuber magnatum TaxID=42249 RepID=A0A317T447_9PEZI|nr:DNA ligase/mRNA capping enzyme [Tuber magnatum]
MSEKLDGVRAYWDGETFRSREGNPFYAPAWFTKRMPKDITLDGELFTTRGGFQDCVSIVRTQNKPDAWKFSVTYKIFDIPSMGHKPFEERIAYLKDLFGRLRIRWVHVLEHTICEGRPHLFDTLDKVTANKGEGLMLREPGSLYVNSRSKTLLKVKRFFDADAIVRGHERGSGKNSNCTGALRVEMLDDNRDPTGKFFKIGTGLTDKQRQNPPKIGTIVVYRFQELSRDGNPRFPAFVGERAD